MTEKPKEIARKQPIEELSGTYPERNRTPNTPLEGPTVDVWEFLSNHLEHPFTPFWKFFEPGYIYNMGFQKW